MGRQHHISLSREFDAHDGPETKYIVVLDGDFPVATCRLFAADEQTAEIGRVVVLEDYRGRGLGRLVVGEAEKWLRELGFRTVSVESRDVAEGFYEKLGYRRTGRPPKAGDTFVCVHMEKPLRQA
jgi:GNAT superfamily N-acetyltransferase